MPILSFVQAGQSSRQNDLSSENWFDITSKNGAIADLWIGIGAGSDCAGGSFLRKVSGVMVAATIDNLGRKSHEQRLRAFRSVKPMELAFSLCTDNALFQAVVEYEGDQNGESGSDPDIHALHSTDAQKALS